MEGPGPEAPILHMPAHQLAPPCADGFLTELAQGILAHRLQLEAARAQVAGLEAMIPALEHQLDAAARRLGLDPDDYFAIFPTARESVPDRWD